MALDFIETARAHSLSYPQMQARDYVKLAYQHANGCEHMIDDEKRAITRIESELDGRCPSIWFERIGNGLARMHLSGGDIQLSSRTVAGMFIYTARAFENRLPLESLLNELTEFAAETDDMMAFITEYKGMGMPPISHSDIYRRLYAPKYRVVLCEFQKFAPLFARIESLLRDKKRALIAIDGMSAAGKTRLAEIMRTVFHANVFHMDDFFLPEDLRTNERLSEIGGNVHRERFKAEVLNDIALGNNISYNAYDCQTGGYKPTVLVNAAAVNVVEGAYSCHPELVDAYDIKVFIGITPEAQSARILKRNGAEMLKRFESLWIPMENKYLNHFHIAENADYTYYV